MAEFFRAEFSGSGDLSGYTPDTGGAFTYPAVDLDNGYFSNTASSYAMGGLADTVLGGGYALADDTPSGVLDTSGGQQISVFQPGTAPTGADFAMEMVFAVDPSTDGGDVLLAARGSLMTVSPWAGAQNFWGAIASFPGDGTCNILTDYASDGYGDLGGTIVDTVSGLGSGLQSHTLRLEVEGTERRIYFDSVLINTDTVVDPNFAAGTDAYIGLFTNDLIYPTTTGALRLDTLTMAGLTAPVEDELIESGTITAVIDYIDLEVETGAIDDALVHLPATMSAEQAGLVTTDFALGPTSKLVEIGALTDAITSVEAYSFVETGTLTNAIAFAGTLVNLDVEHGVLSTEYELDVPQLLVEGGAFTDAKALSTVSSLVEHGAISIATTQSTTFASTLIETASGSTELESVITDVLEENGALTDGQEVAQATALVENGALTSAVLSAFTSVSVETGAASVASSLVVSTAHSVLGTSSDVLVLSTTSSLEEPAAFTDELADLRETFVEEDGALSIVIAQNLDTPTTDTVVSGALTDAVSSLITNAVVISALGTSAIAASAHTVSLLVETGALSLALASAVTGSPCTEHGALTDAQTYSALATTLSTENGVLSELSTSVLTALTSLVEDGFLSDEAQGGGAVGAWTTHLETFAMSRYDGFPFQSMAVVDGVFLGCAEDGVYRLDAETDVGEDISAGIVHDWLDADDPRLKHARYAYFANTTDGQLSFELGYVTPAGAEAAAVYDVPVRTQAGFSNNRVTLGRGIRSRFLRPTISNKDGSDFSINEAVLVVDPADRKV